MLPKPLYSTAQTRELDRLAIETRGIPGIQLMKRAGRVLYQALCQRWPEGPVTVFCGAGNNGGDGYIVAALAKQQRRDVHVVQVAAPGKLTGDALLACQHAMDVGVPMRSSTAEQLSEGVIVDAMLGTGLKGAAREDAARVIDAINRSGLPVVAADIPSGLLADTGSAPGQVVKAALTVTFIGLKQGLLTGRGPDVCGELIYDALGVPADIFPEVASRVQRITVDDFTYCFGPRARHSHKGDYGHVLVIGGDSGFGGAVAMAAEAALRVGAGLVSVATRQEHVPALLARRPELMVKAVRNGHDLEPLMAKATTLVVGPGLGQSAWSQQLLQKAMTSDLPMVLDADGLNLVAARGLAGKPSWIMTPHPGEAARLLGTDIGEIQADRFAALQALYDKYGCPVLLKGAGSLVMNAEKQTIAACHAGNPGMATGGMGDILSGVVGGLAAQGHDADTALAAGVCLHSAAADIASEDGERGLLATDLFGPLKRLVNCR